MKYPSINENEVKETVDFYNQHPDMKPKFRGYDGDTVEGFISSIRKVAIKDNKILERSLIVYHENKDLLTDESIEVVNKLLGDRKIRNKIMLMADGSYLSNRIFGFVDLEKGLIEIKPCVHLYGSSNVYTEFKKLPPKKKIDWLYEHFDVIYVQIKLVKSRFDMLDDIAWEIQQDELDRYYTTSYDY